MRMEGLVFSKEHFWVNPPEAADEDTAFVGLSFFAQEELGDIASVSLPDKGKIVSKDEEVGSIESMKSVSDIIAPVSGEIVEQNGKLAEEPELINTDPYGEGWLFKLKIKDKEELKELMNYQEYQKFTEEQ